MKESLEVLWVILDRYATLDKEMSTEFLEEKNATPSDYEKLMEEHIQLDSVIVDWWLTHKEEVCGK